MITVGVSRNCATEKYLKLEGFSLKNYMQPYFTLCPKINSSEMYRHLNETAVFNYVSNSECNLNLYPFMCIMQFNIFDDLLHVAWNLGAIVDSSILMSTFNMKFS